MLKRKNFAKIKDVYDFPNLLDIQTESYQEFLQIDTPPDKRLNRGLEEVFSEIFPIESNDRSGSSMSVIPSESRSTISRSRRSVPFRMPLRSRSVSA